MMIYNKRNVNIFKSFLQPDLHPDEVVWLSPELCLPDVVLSKIKGPLILEHIWHQGHKILGKTILNLNPKD